MKLNEFLFGFSYWRSHDRKSKSLYQEQLPQSPSIRNVLLQQKEWSHWKTLLLQVRIFYHSSFPLNLGSIIHRFYYVAIRGYLFVFLRNLPPSPKSIIVDTPTPPLRTSSNLSGNTLKNDQIQHTKHLRHIHHNGPTSGSFFFDYPFKNLIYEKSKFVI